MSFYVQKNKKCIDFKMIKLSLLSLGYENEFFSSFWVLKVDWRLFKVIPGSETNKYLFMGYIQGTWSIRGRLSTLIEIH